MQNSGMIGHPPDHSFFMDNSSLSHLKDFPFDFDNDDVLSRVAPELDNPMNTDSNQGKAAQT